MVYKLNYILLSKPAKRGVLYRAIYHAVTSTFGRFMGRYLLEASPRGYSQGWYALDGRNRPYTARDMPIFVNGGLMAVPCNSGLMALVYYVLASVCGAQAKIFFRSCALYCADFFLC